ncbi:MAG: hypothetical protein HQL80_09430 [Magnetococcales bacterium]|nr:hypothetical protein [Magnetococcales bacterium]
MSLDDTAAQKNMVAVAEYIMAQLRLGIPTEEIQKTLAPRGVGGELVLQIKKIFDFVMSHIQKDFTASLRKSVCDHLIALNLDASLVKAIVDKACEYRLQDAKTYAVKYNVCAKSSLPADIELAIQEMIAKGNDTAGNGTPPSAEQPRREGGLRQFLRKMARKPH